MKIVATDRDGNVHALSGNSGQTLMEVLRDADLEVEAVCGGCCSCATCHVLVTDSHWQQQLQPRGAVESELLSMSDHFDSLASRLSCQIACTPALDGIAVTVAPQE